MYVLKDLGRGQWQMVSNRDGFPFRFTGSLDQVYTHSMIGLGIPLEELDTAREVMADQEHDWAHFGVLKSFIYSGYDAGKLH